MLLADACALIMFHGEAGGAMSAAGVAAMRGEDVAVSAVTVWEVSRKVGLGKLAPLHDRAEGSLVGFLVRRGYRLLPLAAGAAEVANALPPHHADPMDRLLIATAMAEGATIITSDRIFAAYGVPVLW
jgi:PIN domain nuclease of toxin-antitoxin system